jgi:hypothetical protein
MELRSLASSQRLLQRRQGQFLVQSLAQMPATDRASENAHHRQVSEVIAQADVGDVRDPKLLWLLDLEAQNQVWLPGKAVFAVGWAPFSPTGAGPR